FYVTTPMFKNLHVAAFVRVQTRYDTRWTANPLPITGSTNPFIGRKPPVDGVRLARPARGHYHSSANGDWLGAGDPRRVGAESRGTDAIVVHNCSYGRRSPSGSGRPDSNCFRWSGM